MTEERSGPESGDIDADVEAHKRRRPATEEPADQQKDDEETQARDEGPVTDDPQ